MKRRALVLILVAFALLFIAATIKSGWLYLVSSVFFALVVLGLLSGWLAVRGLEISRECPREAFEGEPFGVKLSVRNPGRLARYFLLVRDLAFEPAARSGAFSRMRRRRADYMEFARTGTAPRQVEKAASVGFERIDPGSQVEVEYELTAPMRGVYREARLSVSSGGIFGTAEIARAVRVNAPLVVYPRIHFLDHFPFQPRSLTAPVDAFEWSRKGIGQDYFGVREYVRGDSLRHIHWRSSARQGRLIVKEYQQEVRPSAGLVVLLLEPKFGERRVNSLEDGLRCAASILNYYEAMGGQPRLLLPEDRAFALIEESTLYRGLEALAEYEPVRRTGDDREADVLVRALSRARAVLPHGSALAVVTNMSAESVASALGSAPDIDDSSVVVVVDESYGQHWDTGLALLEVAELESPAAGRVDLFVMTRGQEIGECLSEPLSITAI